MASDALDQAIAAVPPQPVGLRTQARIGLLGREDRVALLEVPADITDLELLSMIGAVLQIGDGLRAQRPSSRIMGPNGLPVG